MTHPISKEQAVQLARATGIVNDPKILIITNPDELHRFAQAVYKQGRNAVVDEAKRAIQESSSPFTAAEVHIKRLAIASIESLKDNTP